MILTAKIRINPSKVVQAKLWQTSHVCTEVWNHCIEQRTVNPALTVYEQKRALTQFKKSKAAYKKPCAQVLQNVVFGVDQAVKMFKTKSKHGDTKARPPKYKKSGVFFTQEYPQKNISFKLEQTNNGTVLKLAYGSRPADWLCIPIVKDDYAHAKTITITYKNKKWYACITYTITVPEVKADGEVIYFDPGNKVALTGIKSTAEFHEYCFKPLYYINRASYLLIDKLKSERATKTKGSYHYRRLTQQIRDLYAKIATRTRAYLHILANTILKEHGDVKTFAIGDWSKQETLAHTGNKRVDKRINRAVQNNSPLEMLIKYLTYKALLNGQEVIRFDERGSTRVCAVCSYVHDRGIKPAVRIFTCERCSFTYSRDHHSCLNFAKKYNTVLWQRLSSNMPDRSTRLTLTAFSFKPRSSSYALVAS